jgi:hypothetical protein
MNASLPVAISTCLMLLLAAGLASAQTQPSSADVTLVVPLEIRNLTADITAVQLRCEISSAALLGNRVGVLDIPVTNGQVIATLASAQPPRVTVLVPAAALQSNAPGRDAQYVCRLSGYSPAYGWHEFTVTSNTAQAQLPPPFQLSPRLTPLTGTFQW